MRWYATGAAASSANTMYEIRAPATNSMPSVVAPSTTDDPRSGCLSRSAIIAAHTTMCGTNPTVNALTRSAFLPSE